MKYRILLSETAKLSLKSLDSRVREIIGRKIEELKESPEKRGKALQGDLARFRSIPAAGRFRIVYEVRKLQIIVHVIAIGIRREGDRLDVYAALKRYLRMGLLQAERKRVPDTRLRLLRGMVVHIPHHGVDRSGSADRHPVSNADGGPWRGLFLDYDRFPWFRDTTISSICTVGMSDRDHLYWPELDIDLEIDSARRPDDYPLDAKQGEVASAFETKRRKADAA